VESETGWVVSFGVEELEMAAIPESFKKKLARDAELVTAAAAQNAELAQVLSKLLLSEFRKCLFLNFLNFFSLDFVLFLILF
jgi:hypothetical protein